MKLSNFLTTTKHADKATVMETNQTDPQTLNVDFCHTIGTDTYSILGNALGLTNGTCLVDAKIWLNKRRVDGELTDAVASKLRTKTLWHVQAKTTRFIELLKTDF